MSTDPAVLPRSANKFYEMFLVDFDGNLVDVPAVISNINSLAGDFPNQEQDTSRWILTRRFVIFDTLSGVTVENWPEGPPSVVRYAKSITLKINLDDDNEEMINVPYLYIEYRERTGVYIQDDSLTEVSFNSEYILSTANFWSGAGVVFWIFFAVFVIIFSIVTFNLLKTQQAETDKTAVFTYNLLKTIINSFDIFSSLLFWYLFLMTGYWFVFFKL